MKNISLRLYQQEAIDAAEAAIASDINPVIEVATGGGKSIIAAMLAARYYKATTVPVLMLCPKKELIEQNYEELNGLMPGDVGIYSAGLGRREIMPLTIASINSIFRKPEEFKDFKLIIIDECHLVNSAKGMYKSLITTIGDARIVGLSATPYRADSGSIIDGKIFHKQVYTAGMKELTPQYLSPLTSKVTQHQANTSELSRRGTYGDYMDGEAAKLMMEDEFVDKTTPDIISKVATRNKVLIYCVTVSHATKVAQSLTAAGLPTAVAHGNLSSDERAEILHNLKTGRIKAVANCSLYTTGLNIPDLDCIVMLRPTTSPVLMVQIAGRGTRKAPGKENCLFLDYANNLTTFGPIDSIGVGHCKQSLQKISLRSNKVCNNCGEINAPNAKSCLSCQDVFITVPKLRMFSCATASSEMASSIDDPSFSDFIRIKKLGFTSGVSGAGNPYILFHIHTEGKVYKYYHLMKFDKQWQYAAHLSLWKSITGGNCNAPKRPDEFINRIEEIKAPAYIKLGVAKNGMTKLIGVAYNEQ